MKKLIKASETEKTFRFYFNDGNQKLIEADNIYDALSYVLFVQDLPAEGIYKIEEV